MNIIGQRDMLDEAKRMRSLGESNGFAAIAVGGFLPPAVLAVLRRR